MEPTFFYSRQAEVAIPSGDKNHIISKILSLDFGFLKNDNIRFQYIKHRLLETELTEPVGKR